MNEDEILARLRDIEVPTDTGIELPAEFALWPFAVLACLIAVVLVLRFIGRNRWRRAARRDLDRILSVEDQGRQWSELLTFATGLSARSGRSTTLPDVAFQRPDAIDDGDLRAFVTFLQAELAR